MLNEKTVNGEPVFVCQRAQGSDDFGGFHGKYDISGIVVLSSCIETKLIRGSAGGRRAADVVTAIVRKPLTTDEVSAAIRRASAANARRRALDPVAFNSYSSFVELRMGRDGNTCPKT